MFYCTYSKHTCIVRTFFIVNKVFKFDNMEEHIYKIFGRRVNVENKSNKDEYILKDDTENQIKILFAKDIEFYNALT